MARGAEEMKDEFCEALWKDLGKSRFNAELVELGAMIQLARDDAGQIEKWAQAEEVDTPIFVAPGASKIVPEPLGVVLVMASWNYPV